MILTTPLNYTSSSLNWFEKIRQLAWPVFLDSCRDHHTLGRYDILSACPRKTLVTYHDATIIQSYDIDYKNGLSRHKKANASKVLKDNPFDLIKAELETQKNQNPELPFTGGAMGYFGYDLGKAHSGQKTIPDMALGLYDWAIVVDHNLQKCDLTSVLSSNEHHALLKNVLSLPSLKPKGFTTRKGLTPDWSKDTYHKAFLKVQDYLHAGDAYQINLAMRFNGEFDGDTWPLYLKIRNIHPAPFSGYFKIPELSLLSFSPERFIKIEQRQVSSTPIKGTRKRGKTLAEDEAAKLELIASEKDKAENLMIVDLLRNDLGRNCKTGSIQVPRLFELQSFATVHHLVSTITGTLVENKHPLDLLKEAFPGGSVTGAPKIRAMEIIKELESHPRQLYTGSLGYISYNQNCDTNICIRSLLVFDHTLETWAGGGIVIDSTFESEYQELYHKINFLLNPSRIDG